MYEPDTQKLPWTHRAERLACHDVTTFESSGIRRLAAAEAAPRFTTRLRERRFSAAGVMFTLFLFIGVVPELLEPGCRGTIPRLLFLAIDGPLITIALTLHHDWASRRRLAVRRSLPTTMALATTLGMAAALFAWIMASKLGIDFRQRPDQEALTAPRVIIFGAVTGVIQFVIWALAFVYPFAIEDARLRALEADTHKLEAERLRLEAEKLRLESENLRTTAELASLRSQLEPHFILNTLNAIAGLVTQRPKEARRLLGCVGDLLRDSLHDPDEMQPLDRELTWLSRYTEILESRHAGALVFHWDIDDHARASLVPRLLLQPLVENAVKHGALQRSSGGEVTIRVRLEKSEIAGTEVVCEIGDNGPGMSPEGPRRGAFGLKSVKRRLALKYEGASFRLESSSGGTRSIVRLPHVAIATTAVGQSTP
jgi:signal transduction histidine kinase